MKEFLLIFRHQDGSAKFSQEEMQGMMKLHTDWMNGIIAQDKLVSNGNGLAFDEGKVVRPNDVVTDGPFVETKEAIGGYIIIRANSADEAAELAKGSPVLLGEGNSIEVRKIATHSKN